MKVSIGDVRLYFDVEGAQLEATGRTMTNRPTLLLLHGGPGADHSFFKPEFAQLADVAQLVYLDQRGSGRSDVGDPSAWTWRRWANDVVAFCDALDITRPVLVCSSSGGMVGMLCAAIAPELVGALVLDSTLGVPTELEESLAVFRRRGGIRAEEAARRYLSGDTSDEVTAEWTTYALPMYGSQNDGDIETRRGRGLVNDAVQAHFRRGECGSCDILPYAADITCTTLILAGEDDPVIPSAASERLARSLTNAPVSVEIFDHVGHTVFRQAPDRAFAVVRDFLKVSTEPYRDMATEK
jgi:pimeloyl-ACP methyl ester carboxylesterase